MGKRLVVQRCPTGEYETGNVAASMGSSNWLAFDEEVDGGAWYKWVAGTGWVRLMENPTFGDVTMDSITVDGEEGIDAEVEIDEFTFRFKKGILYELEGL